MPEAYKFTNGGKRKGKFLFLQWVSPTYTGWKVPVLTMTRIIISFGNTVREFKLHTSSEATVYVDLFIVLSLQAKYGLYTSPQNAG